MKNKKLVVNTGLVFTKEKHFEFNNIDQLSKKQIYYRLAINNVSAIDIKNVELVIYDTDTDTTDKILYLTNKFVLDYGLYILNLTKTKYNFDITKYAGDL